MHVFVKRSANAALLRRAKTGFSHFHPPGAASRNGLIIEVIFRVMHAGAVAVAHKDICARAFFKHIGKNLHRP